MTGLPERIRASRLHRQPLLRHLASALVCGAVLYWLTNHLSAYNDYQVGEMTPGSMDNLSMAPFNRNRVFKQMKEFAGLYYREGALDPDHPPIGCNRELNGQNPLVLALAEYNRGGGMQHEQIHRRGWLG